MENLPFHCTQFMIHDTAVKIKEFNYNMDLGECGYFFLGSYALLQTQGEGHLIHPAGIPKALIGHFNTHAFEAKCEPVTGPGYKIT